MNPFAFSNVFKKMTGQTPAVPNYPVCVECKKRENICRYEVGEICLGPITRAPFFRQRPASGTSAVTTMSPGPTCATIQSSAASKPPGTSSSLTHGSSGTRIRELATSVTSSP